MSREVRRVPLDYQHPTEPNPHWQHQVASRLRRGRGLPTLHAPEERFVPLFDDYPARLADWEREGRDLRARTGHHWAFHVKYHLTGYQADDDPEPVVHPFYTWDDQECERPITVRDLDHLHELLLADHATERPDPAGYMPVFDAPEDTLGWCLYETVSEGTPVTPVLATAEALIGHLATVGTDWGQGPMRRAAAEALVTQGGSIGSFLVVDGEVLNGADDADRIATLGEARP